VTQPPLFKPKPREKPSNIRIANAHDANNLRSAREIAETPENFGGEESGLVMWARTVIARLGES
jgi:hypothetical protein